jgi:hypothetical protein
MKDFIALHRMTLPAILLTALLGGCASMGDFSCDMHETQSRGTKPVTTYSLADTKSGEAAFRQLPASSIAQVPTYKIRFKPGFTKPCATVTLLKDVAILRSDETTVMLNEIREFYAEDGTLIATSTQDISEQVKKSGNYIATTPLPIPKSAPPGKYKIVNKLMYERRGDRRAPVQIARAEGFFYIIPSQ